MYIRCECFRIGNGKILSLFDNYLPATRPYFRFLMITCINFNRFYSNFVCALILWRSGLGLLMGNFYQFLTELSDRHMSIFSFAYNNLSKY